MIPLNIKRFYILGAHEKFDVEKITIKKFAIEFIIMESKTGDWTFNWIWTDTEDLIYQILKQKLIYNDPMHMFYEHELSERING